jgi:hypothetical protein
MAYINCRNCSHQFEGNFCPQCGQRSKEHRIDAAYFLHDIPHSILHVDRGFPFTFLQLIKRPAKALEEYLDGKRVSFNRPFGYVVIMSAIGALLTNQVRLLIQYVYLKRTGETLVQKDSFFTHYQSIFIFLMIPLASLCTWIVFKKCRYNFLGAYPDQYLHGSAVKCIIGINTVILTYKVFNYRVGTLFPYVVYYRFYDLLCYHF